MSYNSNYMTDFLEEELQIMDENSSSSGEISNFNIDDPISSLNLHEVITVKSGTSLFDVINMLNDNKIGATVVVDDKNSALGIFTERDILRKVIAKDLDLKKEKIDNYMTKAPETLCENDPIAFALNKMSDGSYRHIPITRNGNVKFMLSVKDIVDEIAFIYRKRILNLPPDLNQQTSQYGG
jgi:CBS domain-containing protein